tara:strand:+ start:698 stop:1018 length:321 start_codon:yes stop_codon:yes gene_type:complete
MAFTDSQGFKIPRPFVNEGGINIESIAGDVTLTYASSTIQILTNGTGSSKDLALPAVKDGAIFWIGNKGAHDIVVKSGGSTIATVAQNKASLVASDGAAWSAVFVS